MKSMSLQVLHIIYNVILMILSEIHIYRRIDCIQCFVNKLKRIAEKIDSYLKNIIPMESLIQKQMQEFKDANNCHICEKPFNAHDEKYITKKYCKKIKHLIC